MNKLFCVLYATLTSVCVLAEAEVSKPLAQYYKAVELIKGYDSYGEPCKKDYDTAASLIDEILCVTDHVASNAAVRADSLYLLGYCYANGFGVVSNSSKAVQLFHESGKIGKCWAIADEAMCYFAGVGVPKDEKKAVELLTKAVEYGADPDKAIADNFIIETEKVLADRNGEKNYTLAYEARDNLALCYMLGMGCERDDARAAQLLNVVDLKFGSTEQGMLAAYYLFKHGDKVRANDILLAGLGKVYTQNIGAENRWWGVGQWNKFFVYPGNQILDEMILDEMLGAMGQAVLRSYAGDYVERDINHALQILKKVYDKDKKFGIRLVDYLCKMSTDRFPSDVDGLIANIARINPSDKGLMGHIGHLFFEGKVLECNEEKAIKFLSDAANGGDRAAQMDLGCCYERGFGVNTNLTEAARWFKAAADGGNICAFQNYGLALIQGRGVPCDVTNGVAYVKKGAEGGDGLAQLTYGSYCLYGSRGVAKHVPVAIRWLHKAVSNGYDRAYYHLGLAYCEPSSYNVFLSLECLLNAKKANDNRSESALADVVGFCTDVPDFEIGKINVYKEDAEAGIAWAQYLYGRALYLGLGCETNVNAALEWALKSARQGNREGMNLAACCLYDLDDVDGATKWEDEAIKYGSIKAIFNRGGRYFRGKDGFQKDRNKAYRYIEIAALCGNAGAIGRQGAMIYFGEGVERSKQDGLRLLKRAADLGDDMSKRMCETLLRGEE